ncbi:hypothetical protein KUCAC02_026902, partial [Chaenocephalus aceratus]
MINGSPIRMYASLLPVSTHLIGRTEARDVGRAPGCRNVWSSDKKADDNKMFSLFPHVWREARHPSEAPDHYTVDGRVEDVVGQETLTEDILHLGDTLKEARENRHLPQDLQQLRAPRSRLYLRKARHVYTPARNALQARVVDAWGNGSHVLGSKIGPYKMYYWDIKQIGPDMELESEVINACLVVKVKDSNRENPRGQRLQPGEPQRTETPTGRTPEDRDSNRENPRGQRATFNDTEKADRPAESRHHKGCRLLAREEEEDDNRKAVHKQSDKPSSKCRKHREEYIQAMRGDKQARELEAVPLSDGTISRRITDMAQDIK